MKRILMLGAIQAFLVFLIGLYIESIASEKLIFFGEFLAPEISEAILKNTFSIFITLGLLNIFFYGISHKTKENKERRNLYNNLCQLIFDEYIKPNTTLENSKFRVSLFKAKKTIILRREKWLMPEYRTILKNVGRFQTRQEKKYSRIKFLPGEGVAGLCYEMGEFVFEEIERYDYRKKEVYYDENFKKLALPKFKSKRTHYQSCSFVGCPIKYFQSDNIFGVIIVDCVEKKQLNIEEFRTIETILSHYSVFFNNNNN